MNLKVSGTTPLRTLPTLTANVIVVTQQQIYGKLDMTDV